MTKSIDQLLIHEFPEAIYSGFELYFPISQSTELLSRLKELKIAVFRIEAFLVNGKSITPLLDSIFDVHGGDRGNFLSFVDYSVLQAHIFLQELQNRNSSFSQIHLCFLLDSSFD